MEVHPPPAGTKGRSISGDPTYTSLSSETVLKALDGNEDGDASLYQTLNKDRLCFDHTERRWYIRESNGHWCEDLKEDSIARVSVVIDAYGHEIKRQTNQRLNAEKAGRKDEASKCSANIDELFKRIRQLQTKKRKVNVVQLAAAGSASLGITGREWDSHGHLVGVENGVVDLRSGKLEPVDPGLYIKTVAPIAWNGLDEPCPTWEACIKDIFDGNEDIVSFVQRLFGYALLGENTEHKFPVFWGPEGRNGKDTIFEALHGSLGEYASPVESELILAQRFNKNAGAASPELLALRGKKIVWASETEESRRFDVAKVKYYTGGGTIVARGLYAKRMVKFKPSFLLCLITNPKPKAKGDDAAFWERVLLIPFTQRFVRNPSGPNEHPVDTEMPKKLREEASGILAWLVRGCLEWQQQGLSPPDEVRSATNEYREEEDDIGRFVRECCEQTERAEIRAKKLFDFYAIWAEENSDRSLKQATFGKKIEAYIDAKRRSSVGYSYFGIKLKDELDPDRNIPAPAF